MRYAFGKIASDYMVQTPARAPWLRKVDELVEGQHTYTVLEDPAGNHYARCTTSAAPVLVRVYPVVQEGSAEQGARH